jgi:hypothetical protein
MLNVASIDIDQELLGDYENGHIGYDDVEDAEGMTLRWRRWTRSKWHP